MHFKRAIVDVPCDIRFSLQFHVVPGMDESHHRAVDDDVRNANFPLDVRQLGKHTSAGCAPDHINVAAHTAVDAQTAAKSNIPVDLGTGADQAVDATLRPVYFF